MKRIVSFLTLLWLLPSSLSCLLAEPVDPALARQVAANFYQAMTGATPTELKLAMQAETFLAEQATREAAQPLYYWYNVGTNQGFVLVAGDDRMKPVLAYSDRGTSDPNDLPDALVKWLAQLRKEARYLVQEDIPATREIATEWDRLRRGQWSASATRAVAPLMTTI